MQYPVSGSFGFRPCLTWLWCCNRIHFIPESFPVKVQIKLVFIHRAVLCPPTCGDLTHCRDSCRMGGRRVRGSREGRRGEVKRGVRGGGFLPFAGLLRGGGKRARKLGFLSRHREAVTSRPALSSHGSDVILLSLKSDPRFLSLGPAESSHAALLSAPI